MEPLSSQWVSKTDVIQYERCPYAFWLIDQGKVTLAEAMGEAVSVILEPGIEFEQKVVADVPIIDAAPEMLPAFFKQKMTPSIRHC